MKPIRVLHVLRAEKPAFYFTNLIDYSDRETVEQSFVNFGPDSEFAETVRDRHCPIFNLGALSKRTLPSAAAKLWKALRSVNPDVVHTHLFDPTYVGLSLAKKQGRKTVVTRHHSDAVHMIASRIKRKFYLTLELQNNERADHIIAPSRMVRECLVDWEKTPPEKVSLIPYPQTIDRFDAVTPDKIKSTRAKLRMNEQLSLVCVSRLFDRKGHIYLFKALAPLVKNELRAKLYLVGEGDYRSKLEEYLRESGLTDKVDFLGWRDDVLEIIGAADIVVHPSLEDALSQSLIESLMLARPIIATDISGASDTLKDGKYGCLVPPQDTDSIRVALEEVIGNLDLARERAKQGRDYLLNYMGAERVVKEYTQIYKRLVG